MGEAFVYCWTDWRDEKLYIGYHLGSPDDGYVCSSEPMLAEYKQRPNDFSRQIVASGSAEDMQNFERVLLQADNTATNENYYNKWQYPPTFTGQTHKEESIEKMKGPRKRGWTRPRVECPDCGNMYANNAIERHRQSGNCPPRNIHDTSKYKQRAKEKYAELKADPVAYRAHLDAHNKRRMENSLT